MKIEVKNVTDCGTIVQMFAVSEEGRPVTINRDHRMFQYFVDGNPGLRLPFVAEYDDAGEVQTLSVEE